MLHSFMGRGLLSQVYDSLIGMVPHRFFGKPFSVGSMLPLLWAKFRYVRLRYLLFNSLVLHSLNTITKEASATAWRLGRSSPDPGVRAAVELLGGDASCLINLRGIGKA